jgi:photosystem I subunit PsaO
LMRDLNVVGFGLIGWLATSSIPAINGKSLTGLFFYSIGTELAHFPTPPALTSQFWLWLVTWHLGLFLCLTFGQSDSRAGLKITSKDNYSCFRLYYMLSLGYV